MNYNHLYYFHVAAEFQNISLAADKLSISQPSLSAQIKTFESSLNKKLFEKKGRNIVLTPDGEKVYHYSKQIFQLTDELTDSIKDGKYLKHEKIKVGVSPQIESTYASDLLSPLLKGTDSLRATVNVLSAEDSELIKQFEFGTLDIIIMNRPIYSSIHQVVSELDMPVVLLANREIAEQVGENNSTAVLFDKIQKKKIGFVLPSNQLKLRHETDIFFQHKKNRPTIMLESDMLPVVTRAVVDGVGLGFLPLAYVQEELKSDMLRILGNKKGYWTHKLFIKSRSQFLQKNIAKILKDVF